MANYYVYKYVKNGQVIYVGQTIDIKSRIKSHEKEAKFASYFPCEIFCCELASEAQMKGMEMLLIDLYQPELNTAYRSNSGGLIEDTLSWVNCEDYISNSFLQEGKRSAYRRKGLVSELSRCEQKLAHAQSNLFNHEWLKDKFLNTDIDWSQNCSIMSHEYKTDRAWANFYILIKGKGGTNCEALGFPAWSMEMQRWLYPYRTTKTIQTRKNRPVEIIPILETGMTVRDAFLEAYEDKHEELMEDVRKYQRLVVQAQEAIRLFDLEQDKA